MPTLRDVAAVAGVSTATVSHVINDTRRITPDTRARVERAIAQLGFVPNAAGRALAMHKGEGRAATRPNLKIAKSSNGGARRAVAARANNVLTPAGPSPDAQESARPAGVARMMLRLVRAAQPISRVEVSRRLGVHRSTVTEILNPLIAAGVVREDGPQPQSGRAPGRPSVALSFGDLKEFFVGVSIGVRRTQVGLTTLGGEVLGEADFETPQGQDEALALTRATVEKLSARAQGRTLKGVGVSVPSPTDADRSRLLHAPHLGWRNADVAGALRFTPQGRASANGSAAPLVVENDASAAALYEARLRLRDASGGSLSNFVLVRSGTGIGVGLVINGEVYRGTGDGEGLAGEFGHMTIVAGGKPCPCGNRGCWERYASAASASSLYVGDRVQMGGQTAPRFVEIVARAEAGELRAQRSLERVGEYLGIGIGNVITGLGVPRVIVSGRLVYGWKFISGPLQEAVGQSMAGRLSGWSVEPGEPSGAGLGGAYEVAVDDFLTRGLGR